VTLCALNRPSRIESHLPEAPASKPGVLLCYRCLKRLPREQECHGGRMLLMKRLFSAR
jgi:hypothetical protein